MDLTKRRLSQPLQVEGITLNKAVAKKLPPKLAFSYHMLPLAMERDQVTVAMADPENKFAIEAVKSALGVKPHIVKSEQSWIDKFLVELWPDYQNDELQLLFCSNNNRTLIAFREYSNYIRNLMMIPECNISTIVGIEDMPSHTIEEAIDTIDLLILEEPTKPKHRKLMLAPGIQRVIKKFQPSVLVARQPQWPIEKILIVLGCENRDHVTLDWIMKLALPSQAEVTMLASLPPVPRMYQGLSGMSVQIPKILKGSSALGKHLECLVGRLEAHGREVRLKIVEGDPKWVIQQEVNEEDYDLIAVTAEPEGWLKGMFLSSVVDPVWDFANRPILIARPPNTKLKSVT